MRYATKTLCWCWCQLSSASTPHSPECLIFFANQRHKTPFSYFYPSFCRWTICYQAFFALLGIASCRSAVALASMRLRLSILMGVGLIWLALLTNRYAQPVSAAMRVGCVPLATAKEHRVHSYRRAFVREAVP